MGLWGPISGYIAINEDKATVYGAYFTHESETAGLGAEIKDNQSWQEKFVGKKLFSGGNTANIALSVNKKVDDPTTQVDGVTGATLTSNGVTEMLHDGLSQYLKFFQDK
jgi:Na+-transporting NADH:ubiquinone oxidoreductase subunit C